MGGAVRDRVLGRPVADLDVVLDGDPAEGARAIASAAKAAGEGAACFALSEEFGAWRVVAHGAAWQVDVEGMRGGSLEADLALRDFTVNAIAEPLDGGEPLDPLGGLADLRVPSACAALGPAPSRMTRCGCCVSCVSRWSSTWSQSRRRSPPRAHRRTDSAMSHLSGCSWSCGGSSPASGRYVGWS